MIRVNNRMSGATRFSFLASERSLIGVKAKCKVHIYRCFTIRQYLECAILFSIYDPDGNAVACRRTMQEAEEFIDIELEKYVRRKVRI